MKEVFDLSTRKGADPVVNSDMTVQVQSFEHPFVSRAGDDAQ